MYPHGAQKALACLNIVTLSLGQVKLAGARLDARVGKAIASMGGLVRGAPAPVKDAATGTSHLWERLRHARRWDEAPSAVFTLERANKPYGALVRDVMAEQQLESTRSRSRARYTPDGRTRLPGLELLPGVSVNPETGRALASGPRLSWAEFTRTQPAGTDPDVLRGRYLTTAPYKSYMRRPESDERTLLRVPKGAPRYQLFDADNSPADALPRSRGFGWGRLLYKGGPVQVDKGPHVFMSTSPQVAVGYAQPVSAHGFQRAKHPRASRETPGNLLQWFYSHAVGRPNVQPHLGYDARTVPKGAIRPPNMGGKAGESPWYESAVDARELGPIQGYNSAGRQNPSPKALGHARVGHYGTYVIGGEDPFAANSPLMHNVRVLGTPSHLVEQGWITPEQAFKAK